MVPKLFYGLGSVVINKKELEALEGIIRRIIIFFANLPQSTPKAAIYSEFGIMPAFSEVAKRKLLMWHRLHQQSTNQLIKEVVQEQICSSMTWFKDMAKIATYFQINLMDAGKKTKFEWKKIIKQKIKQQTRIDLQKEL